MKRHYLNQDTPDLDDGDRNKMVRDGVVPETCLAGGSMLLQMVKVYEDPCALCPFPRKRCMGRPQTYVAPNTTGQRGELKRKEWTLNDEPSARRDIRAGWRAKILADLRGD